MIHTTANKKQYNLSHRILQLFQENDRRSFNHKQVAKALHIKDSATSHDIIDILEELKEGGYLNEEYRGKYSFKIEEKIITGRVDMTKQGEGYIVSESSDRDVYVPSHKIGYALHGDMVKVCVKTRRKGKEEGEVLEIILREKKEYTGILHVSNRNAFLTPDEQKMHTDIFIPLHSLKGAVNGQKVIVHLTDDKPVSVQPQYVRTALCPVGRVVNVLGRPGEHQAEMNAILAEYGLPGEFPVHVEKEAGKIPVEITEEEIAKRKDFRKILTCTIDPVDAKDFDDALSFRMLDNGQFEIGVHIADVSHYVKPDSLIDKEAINRATSVYLVDRVIPMLPEVLSNQVCSLRPDEDKLTFSAVFVMDSNAKIIKHWLGKSIIRSCRRFTYEEVQDILVPPQSHSSPVIGETKVHSNDSASEALVTALKTLNHFAKVMRKNRIKDGAIAFDKVEVKFRLDEKGNPTGVYFKHQREAHHLIEEFMLLANRTVAEFAGKNKKQDGIEKDKSRKLHEKTFVYRIHDRPDEEKLNNFAQFVKQFGYSLHTENHKKIAASMNALLENVKGKGEEGMIETLAIRSMAKAVYSTQNIGHYGLGFDHYTHFTSPIRRYPDVMVHRLLGHYLNNGTSPRADEYETLCKNSSLKERSAEEAERASVRYKQVQFLKDRVGEEFEGVVSGVTEWGIYVELVENLCEGMVRLRDIPGDYFEFQKKNYCVVGRRSGRRLRLGDKLRVEIKRADLIKKQVDFEIVDRR